MSVKYKKYGFSIVEALMSMVIVGIIILMTAPMFAGRTERTSGSTCVQGESIFLTADIKNYPKNSPYICQNGTCTIPPGVDKILVTTVNAGASGETLDVTGSKKTTVANGGNAGVPGDVGYFYFRIPSANGATLKYTVGTPGTIVGANTAVTVTDEKGKNIIPADQETENRIRNPQNVQNQAQNLSYSGSYSHGGSMDYGAFPVGKYGAGGRGGFNASSVDTTTESKGVGGAILIEWSTNCVATENLQE